MMLMMMIIIIILIISEYCIYHTLSINVLNKIDIHLKKM